MRSTRGVGQLRLGAGQPAHDPEPGHVGHRAGDCGRDLQTRYDTLRSFRVWVLDGNRLVQLHWTADAPTGAQATAALPDLAWVRQVVDRAALASRSSASAT